MIVQQDQNTCNAIQDQNWIFFFWTTNNEQWKVKESNENKSQTKDEQNSKKVEQQLNKSNNNNKLTRYNWHMSTMHNINKSRVSLLKQVEMWPSRHCTELKKYPCDYGTDDYNPIWPGINSEISHGNEGLCAYLKK
jgi:hypothetical protein